MAYIGDTIAEPRALYRLVLAQSEVRSWRMPGRGEDPLAVWAKDYYHDGRWRDDSPKSDGSGSRDDGGKLGAEVWGGGRVESIGRAVEADGGYDGTRGVDDGDTNTVHFEVKLLISPGESV